MTPKFLTAKPLLAAAALAAALIFALPAPGARADVDVDIGIGIGGFYPGYHDSGYGGGYGHGYGYGHGHGRPAISCGTGRRIVMRSGFRNVRAFDCGRPSYGYRAWKHGREFVVRVNGRGDITGVRRAY